MPLSGPGRRLLYGWLFSLSLCPPFLTMITSNGSLIFYGAPAQWPLWLLSHFAAIMDSSCTQTSWHLQGIPPGVSSPFSWPASWWLKNWAEGGILGSEESVAALSYHRILKAIEVPRCRAQVGGHRGGARRDSGSAWLLWWHLAALGGRLVLLLRTVSLMSIPKQVWRSTIPPPLLSFSDLQALPPCLYAHLGCLHLLNS